MYMKNVFYFSLTFLAIIIGTIFLSNSGGFRGYEDNANYSYDAPVMMFNKTGQVRRQVKIWSDTVAITTASGQVIDISSAGFTGITNVQIQAESNTASASNAPFMSIKTFTATTVTVNTLQSNTSLISILGVNVVGLQFLQSTSGVRAHLTVLGY